MYFDFYLICFEVITEREVLESENHFESVLDIDKDDIL